MLSVKMTFQHRGDSLAENKSISPTDSGICIFWTKFIMNEKEIEMKLKLKKEAEQRYQEVKEETKAAIIGESLPNGLSGFSAGNLEPNQLYVVILECAMSSRLTNSTICFTDFPFEAWTATQKSISLDTILSGSFSFQMYLEDSIQQILKVSTNCGGIWNDSTKIFSMNQIPSSSIILTTVFSESIQNCHSSTKTLFTQQFS
jgi:hypothetical protein